MSLSIYNNNTLVAAQQESNPVKISLPSAVDMSAVALAAAADAETWAEQSALGGPSFDTVSALGAASDLIEGQVVNTFGYFAPGDGGGMRYEIVSAGAPPSTAPIVVAVSGGANALGDQDGLGGQAFPRSARVFMWLALTSGGAGQWVQDPDFAGTAYYVPGASPAIAVGGGHNNVGLAYAHRAQAELERDVYVVLTGKDALISEWVGSGAASAQYVILRNNVAAVMLFAPVSDSNSYTVDFSAIGRWF